MFITNNDASFHLWWKNNLLMYQKSQNIMSMVVDLRVSRRKNSQYTFENNVFFLLVFLVKCLSKCPSSIKRPLHWKISGCSPTLSISSFCKTLHLKSLTILHQTHSLLCHIQNSAYSGICRHIQTYSVCKCIFTHI